VNTQTVLQLAEAIGVIVIGFGSAWFSRKAARLSEPTGNGWADHVKDSLHRIESRMDRIESRVDKLTDHMLDDGR
jgi:hypothetical protein